MSAKIPHPQIGFGVSLNDIELAQLDEAARSEDMSRASLVRMILQEWLRRRHDDEHA